MGIQVCEGLEGGRIMNGLALCSGRGGIEEGLRSALPSLRFLAHVESDAYVQRLLRGWVWTDLCTFDGSALRGRISIITAGFPCQPFSTASRGRKVAPDLWPEVHRVIREVSPSWVFCENVQRAPIERAAQALREDGFSSAFVKLCPSEVGAPMRRPRWWLLAHAHHEGEPELPIDDEVARLQEAAQADEWANGPGGVLGMDVRAKHRMHRLRVLGNGVLPSEARRSFVYLAKGLS